MAPIKPNESTTKKAPMTAKERKAKHKASDLEAYRKKDREGAKRRRLEKKEKGHKTISVSITTPGPNASKATLDRSKKHSFKALMKVVEASNGIQQLSVEKEAETQQQFSKNRLEGNKEFMGLMGKALDIIKDGSVDDDDDDASLPDFEEPSNMEEAAESNGSEVIDLVDDGTPTSFDDWSSRWEPSDNAPYRAHFAHDGFVPRGNVPGTCNSMSGGIVQVTCDHNAWKDMTSVDLETQLYRLAGYTTGKGKGLGRNLELAREFLPPIIEDAIDLINSERILLSHPPELEDYSVPQPFRLQDTESLMRAQEMVSRYLAKAVGGPFQRVVLVEKTAEQKAFEEEVARRHRSS